MSVGTSVVFLPIVSLAGHGIKPAVMVTYRPVYESYTTAIKAFSMRICCKKQKQVQPTCTCTAETLKNNKYYTSELF